MFLRIDGSYLLPHKDWYSPMKAGLAKGGGREATSARFLRDAMKQFLKNIETAGPPPLLDQFSRRGVRRYHEMSSHH